MAATLHCTERDSDKEELVTDLIAEDWVTGVVEVGLGVMVLTVVAEVVVGTTEEIT